MCPRFSARGELFAPSTSFSAACQIREGLIKSLRPFELSANLNRSFHVVERLAARVAHSPELWETELWQSAVFGLQNESATSRRAEFVMPAMHSSRPTLANWARPEFSSSSTRTSARRRSRRRSVGKLLEFRGSRVVDRRMLFLRACTPRRIDFR